MSERMGALKTAGSGVVPLFSPEREKTERTGREVMLLSICDPQMRAGQKVLSKAGNERRRGGNG